MTHSIAIAARVLDPDIELDVTSFRVKLDEGWAPFVQGTLVAHYPSGTPTAAAIRAINPQTQERRIRITITQTWKYRWLVADLTRTYLGRTVADLTAEFTGLTCADLTARFTEAFQPSPPADYVREMTLLIRRRAIRHGSSTVELSVKSDEAAAQDDAHVDTLPLTPPGAKLHEIVRHVLARSGRVLGDMSSVAASMNVNPALTPWRPGVTAWDYLQAQVRFAGLYLWANEFGMWRLRESHPIPADLGEIGPGVNLIQLDDIIDRDQDFYTSALLTYRWSDTLGVQHEQPDAHSLSRYPVRVYTETFDGVPYPGVGSAAAFIANLSRRGRPMEVPAVADWRMTVAQLIDVTTPEGDVIPAAVSSIELSWPEDEMTIKTRDRG